MTEEKGKWIKDETSSGYTRLSCRCGRAIIKWDYINDTEWRKLVKNFKKTHVCDGEPL